LKEKDPYSLYALEERFFVFLRRMEYAGDSFWYRHSRIAGNAKEHAPFQVEQRIHICNNVPGKTESTDINSWRRVQ
jgi:hypothetical protein